MSSREIPDSLIFKLMVVKELRKLGCVNVHEFPDLVSKIAQHLNSMGYSISPNDIIHLLDVIRISNGKITLSSEGLYYLQAIEILTNNITKTP